MNYIESLIRNIQYNIIYSYTKFEQSYLLRYLYLLSL